MRRIKGIKPSAALMVAVVALVAALGGGAVAGVTISKLNSKEKKQVKKISKKQAKKLDERIELTPGPKGDTGEKGDPGDPGTAAAFAHVRNDGTVVSSQSSNISDANISTPSNGVYCVGGLDFEIRHAQATPEAISNTMAHDRLAEVLLADPGSTPSGCSPGDELRVQIYDVSVGGLDGLPFYLLLED